MDASAILVVDPQPLAMKHFFSQGGFIVDCAAGRGEARTLIASNFYAAIIANLQALGPQEGLDLVMAARDRAPGTRIVLLSDTAEFEERERLHGADAVVRHSPLIAIAHCVCSLLEVAQ
jgi:DNA-binding response OmpR family regulator